MSVYLCLPQRYMSTHYRWLRMMIALAVTEMEIVRGRPATGFPVLMVLDEFAGLKRMEVIEHAVAQIAGYGAKLFFVLQSLEQLKAAYKDNWETFLSNSGLKIFFSLDDHFSREYVSKLVGDTEVIREVRSASDSVSESESYSHTIGTSTSRGTSISEGTNRSTSDSVSRGVNSSISTSKGRSWSHSWNPTGMFGFGHENDQYSRGSNSSKSRSEGASRGWSHSETRGTSHSKSESYGSGTTETFGETHGVSQSRTTGASETVHRRPLVSPDEIGHLFARVNDVDEAVYPGLALIVISGERTIALRRVNYFEDCYFAKRFAPHPDFPAAPCWKELGVSLFGLQPYTDFLIAAGVERKVNAWLVDVGQIVSRGDPVVSLRVQGTPVHIRSPYTGMITDVPKNPEAGGATWFFKLRYSGDQESADYPFQELADFTRALAVQIGTQMSKALRSAWVMAGIEILLLIGLIGTEKWTLLGPMGLIAFYGARKAAEFGKYKQIVRKCPHALLRNTLPFDDTAWKISEELLPSGNLALPKAM